jgi:hypothetical protein
MFVDSKVSIKERYDDDDDDQWSYSSDRALAFLYGFHDSFIVRCGVISSTIDLF